MIEATGYKPPLILTVTGKGSWIGDGSRWAVEQRAQKKGPAKFWVSDLYGDWKKGPLDSMDDVVAVLEKKTGRKVKVQDTVAEDGASPRKVAHMTTGRDPLFDLIMEASSTGQRSEQEKALDAKMLSDLEIGMAPVIAFRGQHLMDVQGMRIQANHWARHPVKAVSVAGKRMMKAVEMLMNSLEAISTDYADIKQGLSGKDQWAEATDKTTPVITEAKAAVADLGPARQHRWSLCYLHGDAEDLMGNDVFYADVPLERIGEGVHPVSLLGKPATAYLFQEANGPRVVGYIVLDSDRKANDEAKIAMKTRMPTL